MVSPYPAPKTQTEINRGSRNACLVTSQELCGTSPTVRPGPTLSLAFPERFQGDSHLEQSGCYHHCVDENIERRNHYLDLAGIENYTSQFGPGTGAPSLAGGAWGGRGGGAGGRGEGVHWPPGLGGGVAFTRVIRVFFEETILKTFERLK